LLGARSLGGRIEVWKHRLCCCIRATPAACTNASHPLGLAQDAAPLMPAPHPESTILLGCQVLDLTRGLGLAEQAVYQAALMSFGVGGA